MGSQSSDAMIEKLVASGRKVMALRDGGDKETEAELLQFMDSVWDQMSSELRQQAKKALLEEGLDELAKRVAAGNAEG